VKLRIARLVVAFLLVVSATPLTFAQTSTQTTSALPRLVRFGGTAKDLNGSPLTGVVGITFALYSEQSGGAPLWLETQNVTADNNGHYTALLGSTKPDGLPAELFTSEQARWVGVQVSGQADQPRVLLVSAPYALKAGDAETIGGLPPSAFVLAAPVAIGSAPGSSTAATVPPPAAAADVTTTGGTLNFLPIFSGADTIIDSAVFQTGSGTTAKVGIDTTTPATQLDVNGAGTIRGTLTLPATSAATAHLGKNSQGLNLVASSFSSTSSTALNQTFRWQAEPAANDTTAPSGTLNLQYGLGATAPSETGLKISSKGLVTFATGQTFPGTGAGTITGITTAAGSGLAGGGVKGTLTLSVPAAGVTNAMLAHPSLTVTAGTGLTGGGLVALGNSITLNVNTAKIPQLSTANAFVGNQTVTGSVTATSFTGNGAGLSNVTASNSNELGGLASSAYAQLAAANTFTVSQTVNLNGTTALVLPSAVVGSTSTPSFVGVEGINTSTSTFAVTAGVLGEAATQTGYGVWGINSGTAGFGTGVFGQTAAPSGTGVLGTSSGRSTTSTQFSGSPGVWGDTGGAAESNFVGVVGTADDNSAGNFFNNSPGDATLFLGNNSKSETATVLIAKGDNVGGLCTIDVSGNLACNGNLSGANLSAVVSAEGGARKVALYAMQSPENWFEDFGSGALTNGAATITFDPAFTQTVNTGTEYHVFLTPNGDSKGLYVSEKTVTSFEVREQGGGASSVAFDYRIVAKRVGYEKIRLADVTERFNRQEARSKNMRRPAGSSADPRSGSQITTPPPAHPVVEQQLAPKMLVLPVLPSAAPRPVPVTPKLTPAPPVRAALQPMAAQPK
jgi:hypothetical protein